MQTFDLNNGFQNYLDTFGFDAATMNPLQLIETRRAFFGGLSLMHQLVEQAHENPEPADGKKTIDDLEDQFTIFWADEMNSLSGITKNSENFNNSENSGT